MEIHLDSAEMNRTPQLSRSRSALCYRALRAFAQLAACIALTILARAPANAIGAAEPSGEAEIRAAFIFNFAKFTKWPTGTFADANAPLTVGFVGAEDARASFQQTSSGKLVNGRQIIAVHLDSAPSSRQCQIPFLRQAKGGPAASASKSGNDEGILTIGESEDFLSCGGIIRLFVEGNRMRFDVNVGAAHRAKIRLSSKLLALARSVVDFPQPEGD